MANALARNIICKCAVRTAGQGDAMYVLASDQTVWLLTMSSTAGWNQLPSIPQPATGVRNILDITASRWPGMPDSLYAHCDDGTVWMLTVGSPPIWGPLPTLPQPAVTPTL
jgi:hypothetical protein